MFLVKATQIYPVVIWSLEVAIYFSIARESKISPDYLFPRYSSNEALKAP